MHCCVCGKTVRKPLYAPVNEESNSYAEYHKRCLEKRAKQWDRQNNTKEKQS